MRIASWLLVCGVATSVLAGDTGLPSGKFEGKGVWRGPAGSGGSYAVTTEIAGRTLTSRYDWSEPGKAGRIESIVVTFGPEGKDAAVPVTDVSGKPIGDGFCFDGECFYRAEFGGIVVEETIRWTDGRLHKLGTKSGPGFKVVWSEDLASM